MQTSLIALPVKLIATYFTLFILTHIADEKKDVGKSLVYLFISIPLFGILQRTVSYELIYPSYYPEGLTRPLLYPPKVIIETFGVYSVAAIVAAIYFTKTWYFGQQEKQQLSNEKLQSELKFLKGQIHPHFLFNTLNNLYTLTLAKSNKAPEVVDKLSQLMSYMLYDSNKTRVPLKMELDHITNYISLEKIRYCERLDVSLDVLSDIDDIEIEPLLILPLVENSFKHGFKNETGKVWVHISVLTNEEQLIIKVENSMGDEAPVNGNGYHGVGLSNVEKRLELIYKDRYSFQVFKEDTFIVILRLTPDRRQPVKQENKYHEMLNS
nr:histidine kinase [Hufsiella arboris]